MIAGTCQNAPKGLCVDRRPGQYRLSYPGRCADVNSTARCLAASAPKYRYTLAEIAAAAARCGFTGTVDLIADDKREGIPETETRSALIEALTHEGAMVSDHEAFKPYVYLVRALRAAA